MQVWLKPCTSSDMNLSISLELSDNSWLQFFPCGTLPEIQDFYASIFPMCFPWPYKTSQLHLTDYAVCSKVKVALNTPLWPLIVREAVNIHKWSTVRRSALSCFLKIVLFHNQQALAKEKHPVVLPFWNAKLMCWILSKEISNLCLITKMCQIKLNTLQRRTPDNCCCPVILESG